MLRRDRLIRMQIHQLMDACIFAVAFWLAYVFRSNADVRDLFGQAEISPFTDYVWLYLILMPTAPMVLEAQGFYDRPAFCLRQQTVWQLFKGCLFTALVLVIALFFRRVQMARSVVLWFGVFSFALMFVKEELVRMALRSQMGRSQYRRRFIVVGTGEEAGRLR